MGAHIDRICTVVPPLSEVPLSVVSVITANSGPKVLNGEFLK